MRLSDLLGVRVVDARGNNVGTVADVRLVQDGPLQQSKQAALRVDGLIVVERRVTRLFGYERHVGPALLRRIVHSRLGAVRYLPWQDIEHLSPDLVRSRSTDLQPFEELPTRLDPHQLPSH
ncbi:PRC-barrel domain-containing protein [Kribbella monticola]|uniref:PRC-barrel domain-containing protein n=1 Tax=Kribbella monticola TaxID=2185285 RepID=UPI000DD49201|nr:PRC-barrel domain-containing protein [Kribbella monticola]